MECASDLSAPRRAAYALPLILSASVWSCGGSTVAENARADHGDASSGTGGTPLDGSSTVSDSPSSSASSSAEAGDGAPQRAGCGCRATASIEAGASSDGCGANLLRCGSICADPYSDPTHCGACGVKCSTPTPICFDGTCEPAALCPSSCGPGEECCGDRCCGPDEQCCASILYSSSGLGPPLGGPTPALACVPRSTGSSCGFDPCEACWWSKMHVSAGLSPCNDGSGRTDCCPADLNGSCADEGLQCWTPCTGGQRARHFCNGSFWVGGTGIGVFPCGGDAH